MSIASRFAREMLAASMPALLAPAVLAQGWPTKTVIVVGATID